MEKHTYFAGTVTVQGKEGEWKAFVTPNPHLTASGVSKEEALGKLVVAYHQDISEAIKSSAQNLEVVGKDLSGQQLAPPNKY